MLEFDRLHYRAGIGGLNSGEFRSIVLEMLEVKLQMIDVSEVKNQRAARIKEFERVLSIAVQKEKDAELLEKAGLSNRLELLVAKSWRLNIQTQLEQEKQD